MSAFQSGITEPAGSAQPPGDDRRSNLRVLIVIAAIAVILGVLVGIFNPLVNHAASVEGQNFDLLFSGMLGVATAIFVIVEGGLLYSIRTFRQRSEDDEEEVRPVRGHLGLEILWTAIPAVLVTATALSSYLVLWANERVQPDAMTVEVTGRQFVWQFYYPSLNVTSTELHVPIGQQIHLELHSEDVIHQFWVPAYRMQLAVLPETVTDLRFTARQPGTFLVECNKICGVGHSEMRTQLVAETQDQFAAWLASQSSSVVQPAGSAQASSPLAQGRQVFQLNGCAACHTLKDVGASGTIGPDLDGIGTLAAQQIKDPSYKGHATTAQDRIREAIVSPYTYIPPGFQANVMPGNFGQTIKPDDLDALVSYLAAQK